MNPFRTVHRLFLTALLLLAPISLAAAPIPKLASVPLGERWFSVSLGGERVGFARTIVAPLGAGYQIKSDASVKMVVMGFSREACSSEEYVVGSDLSLKSFTVEETLDKTPTTLKGKSTANGVQVTVETKGGKKEKALKGKGPVYPPPVLNLVPLVRGEEKGKTFKVQMFDPEAIKLKQVKMTLVGMEELEGKPVIHLQNDLYPFVDNDIWLDLEGNDLKESVRDDLVLTLAEDAKTAKRHLAEDALSRKDDLLDFSTIALDRPVEKPAEVKRLVIDLSGIPHDLPLLHGVRQEGTRLENGTVRFTLAPRQGGGGEPPPGAAELRPALVAANGAAELRARRDAIVGEERVPARVAARLAEWVSREIQVTGADAQPLETLKSKGGNAPSHARLYTALARAAAIPTRVVSGVVYAPGQGYRYHSWAESYLGGWVPVDPTFGQHPADLTHIKLVNGDGPDDLALLGETIIGRVKGKVVEQQY